MTLEDILRSPAVWTAAIAFIGALANYLLPNIPTEVKTAFLALLGSIMAVVAVAEVRQRTEIRKAKEAKAKARAKELEP